MTLTGSLIRPLQTDDYYNGYLKLLQQGFTITPSKISIEDFTRFVNDVNKHTFVIEQTSNHVPETNIQIVASATVIIEQKLIRDMGKVCHIEDVVVDKSSRGKGFGKHIIYHCFELARQHGCYKCILNCDEDKVKFYEKCDSGFYQTGVEMVSYL